MTNAPASYQKPNKTFDLKTHIRDGKGNIVQENHYNLVIDNGVMTFERPPGSGYFYDGAGTLIRSPKESSEKKIEDTKTELDPELLLKQIAELKAQIAATAEIDKTVEAPLALMEDIQEQETEDEKPKNVKAFVKPTYIKK